ncbi:hypothetical protein [Photobacterium angustum]|uniref:hypothetical protein n=1 Tax=Photobacterium angustum TaxID=661 RepID=UPI000B2D5252|nr:hypothetical protein [Photobacterium angustum]
MKKWSLLALASFFLLGCGSNDAEDAIVETVGLNIDSLSSQQKQDYAQISTDINTLIVHIGGQCLDAESNKNPSLTLTGFTCNIADYKTSESQTQFSSISLISGTLDITRLAKPTSKFKPKITLSFMLLALAMAH